MKRQSGYYWVQVKVMETKTILEYDEITNMWRVFGDEYKISNDSINAHCSFISDTPLEFSQVEDDKPLRKEIVMKFIVSGKPFNSEEINQMAEYIKTGK